MHTSTPIQFKKRSKSAVKSIESPQAAKQFTVRERSKEWSSISSPSILHANEQTEIGSSQDLFEVPQGSKIDEKLVLREKFSARIGANDTNDSSEENNHKTQNISFSCTSSNFSASPIFNSPDQVGGIRVMHETASSDHVPKEDMKYTQDNLAECEAKASYYLIQVHLKGGKDLVIRDSSGTSDPYVKFKYKNKTIYKSSIIFKNLNPQWNERFAYTVDDLSLGLTLNVYDYDRFGSDDYMGSADLNISEIPLNRPTDLELMLGQSKSQEYMGYLIIQVTIATVTEKDCNQLTRKRISPETSAIAKKTKLVTTHSWTSVVNIVLVEAKNLHDVSSWSLLPDAYVKFRLGPEKYKSKVISKCSHPKWLEQFDMHGYDDQRFLLEVLVCDKRRNLEIGR